LRDRIAEVLRKAILDGSLAEGSRIVERKLAAQFDTSLTAVREALIELEVEGFVVKKPNSATFVTQLSLEIT
jgi:DNA-binding GntR family transcriptional regulator